LRASDLLPYSVEFTKEKKTMSVRPKTYILGSGIGGLAAAAFMIRDGKLIGDDIQILEASSRVGGSLDADGDGKAGYFMRGGRMFTMANYECTWELFKSIPSLDNPNQSVYEETVEFNRHHETHSLARLLDKNGAQEHASRMGLSNDDRLKLLALYDTSEDRLALSAITDWLSPHFFDSNFWLMWSTTFAFQPWHSAIEIKRYLHRFAMEFSRIDTLSGVKRTIFNQYDSMVLPLLAWLKIRGVRVVNDCRVTQIDTIDSGGLVRITALRMVTARDERMIRIDPEDRVIIENASMTDASSVGSMMDPPQKLTKIDSSGWKLWESLAHDRPLFGNPGAFNGSVAHSCWESFTVTFRTPLFFDQMTLLTGNEPGTGALVTFKDSNWLMSVVLAHQPHFRNQAPDIQVLWGYGLHPHNIGNFVAKPMEDCTGQDILKELCGHLKFNADIIASATCIPCRMPYITSMFMPRQAGDRPDPLPANAANFAFVSQFVEIPDDVVFTVEYSIRAAQMAVYSLLSIDREIPPVTRHDHSFGVMFDAFVKAFE
jgi:oleate hydratase